MTTATAPHLQELALLFTYPWDKPSLKDRALASQVAPFLRFAERASLEELQDTFTATFDLAPTLAPYLAFHIHGESYRRGAVMATLRGLYARYGVDEMGELPDHVGIVLHLLAVAGPDETLDALVRDELAPGLARLRALAAKEASDNPYRSLLDAAATAMEARLA